jgi:hypothetical protein
LLQERAFQKGAEDERELAPMGDTVPRLTGSPATGLESFFTRESGAIERLSERLSARGS